MEKVLRVFIFTVLGCVGVCLVSSSLTFTAIRDSSLATPYVTEAGHNAITCSRKCSRDGSCRAVAFDPATSTCSLGNVSVHDNPTTAVVSQAGSVVYQAGCNDGWVFYSGTCYKYVDIHATWNDSQTYCQGLGGTLAHVTDLTHLAFLNNLVTCLKGEPYCYPWIAYNDIDLEKSLVGVDGQPIPAELLNVTTSNTDLNDCVFIDPMSDTDLYMYECTDSCVFFCEMKI